MGIYCMPVYADTHPCCVFYCWCTYVDVISSVELQVKEGECESFRHKLEVLEAKYSALEYQLKADEEEHSTRCSRYNEMHVCQLFGSLYVKCTYVRSIVHSVHIGNSVCICAYAHMYVHVCIFCEVCLHMDYSRIVFAYTYVYT